MLKSIYTKFLLGYILFGLLGFLTIALFSERMTYDYLVRRNAADLYDEASAMAASFEDSSYYLGEVDSSVTGSLSLVAGFIDADIWITDSDGRIVIDTGKIHTGQSIEDFDPVSSSSGYIIGNYHSMFPADMLTVSAPINHNYTTIGHLIIHYPMDLVTSSTNEILNIVYITSLIIFALSFIILVIFTIYVYDPLREINRAAKEYAAGNLDYKMSIPASRDEIGTLARTLDVMISDLNNSEKYQRDFIANVSHDLRSPLTSIRGYLEAILDGTIPPDKTEVYMRRIISETDRLTKLAESMISLSSMDKNLILKPATFDINELIRTVCASNESNCYARNIGFSLTFEDEVEPVYADYSKIQQVLYNLVDNAVKFSHRNSTIYISTEVRQKKVFVSVKDTGVGIPKDSVKKIWDRFYKTDASRGKDRSGTGLGLSIVREIILAHGENIDVVSTEGAGTEFTFTLPVAE